MTEQTETTTSKTLPRTDAAETWTFFASVRVEPPGERL